jgi:hypothetical protein
MGKKHKQIKSNKYIGYSQIAESIDLHNLNGPGQYIEQRDVFHELDSFIEDMKQKYAGNIKKFGRVKIGIICGKGNHSRRQIHGKNPLRVFTERYIKQCGYQWRNGKVSEGEHGVIVVDVA